MILLFMKGGSKTCFFQRLDFLLLPQVTGWKFDQMDVDRNGVLVKREFRTFRRSVKRLARNKVCAGNFWRYCDMDSDGAMTKSEWSNCLGLNVNSEYY